MNQYPTWKNLLVLICVIAGIGFALPNFYGEDPALMIAKENGLTFSEQEIEEIEKFLSEDSVSFSKIEDKDGEVLIRFNNVEDQIQASDKVRAFLGRFSIKIIFFGCLNFANLSDKYFLTSISERLLFFRTIAATTASPKSLCGEANTADSKIVSI